MPSIFTFAAMFLAGINVVAIVCFGVDKLCARAGWRRISEAELLALALVGGSPGALLARQLFRHKTRKEPFSSQLWRIVFIQVVGIGLVGGFMLAG